VLQAQGSLLFRNRNNSEALRYFKEALAVLQRCSDHTFDQVMSTIQGVVYAADLVGQKDEANRLIVEAVRQCEQERGGESSSDGGVAKNEG
jgi:hypothetical protein